MTGPRMSSRSGTPSTAAGPKLPAPWPMKQKLTGLPCMSGPDRPIQPENRLEARRWLAIVEEDIDVAIAAARLSRRGASAYHVQQAAEKLIKALLVLAAEPFRRTHDLDDLAARLPLIYPQFAVQAEAVRHLSIWGVAYRY